MLSQSVPRDFAPVFGIQVPIFFAQRQSLRNRARCCESLLHRPDSYATLQNCGPIEGQLHANTYRTLLGLSAAGALCVGSRAAPLA